MLRLLYSIVGGFHRGFPLLRQSLAAAILHTTSKDYSIVLISVNITMAECSVPVVCFGVFGFFFGMSST
jgi:hypothetical protein